MEMRTQYAVLRCPVQEHMLHQGDVGVIVDTSPAEDLTVVRFHHADGQVALRVTLKREEFRLLPEKDAFYVSPILHA